MDNPFARSTLAADATTTFTASPAQRRELSLEQKRAIVMTKDWLGAPGTQPDQPVFRLWGKAGTGKSTILAELPQHLGNGRNVLYGAYTGKAASVLRNKGCHDAATLHSLAYRPIFEDKVFVGFEPDPDSKIRDADLLIIDEASMIDGELGKVLLSFGTPVLVVGDPMQLPPVNGTGFFTGTIPDFTLKQGHRHTPGSLAEFVARVRAGSRATRGMVGPVRTIPSSDIVVGDVLDCDQILVGKNATRARYNARVRELLGRDGPLPELGDKLVCRKNNAKSGFYNGETWHVVRPPRIEKGKVKLAISADGDAGRDAVRRLSLPVADFVTGKSAPSLPARGQTNRFEFGYALTVHMAQGSEWSNVLLIDEAECMHENADQWFYSAVTRASQQLTIVQS